MTNQKLKILVVDDEPFVRDMLRAILISDNGIGEIHMAENGIQAIETLRTDPCYDLIVSDMDMPEMNGLELIRRLRGEKAEIPIIILTGNSEIKVAIEAMKSGASDYLLKDENIEDTIFISVGKVMEKYRLEMENRRLLEDLARKNRELERLSFLDGLTDIPNRRYFDQVIQQEWMRALREEVPFSLIMIDIDYFKLYNDTYGHQEGDRCLKQVAQALNSSLRRPGDFAARYGGEEFTTILPDTPIEGGIHVAKTMQARIAALDIPHAASQVSRRVTVSMGVATAIPDNNTEASNLILLADQALYHAKREGRDRIKHISTEKTESGGDENKKNSCH